MRKPQKQMQRAATMWRSAALLLLLSVCSVCAEPTSAPRTLVLLQNSRLRDSHSTFFESLKQRGHDLSFKDASSKTALQKYGEFKYENVILFSSGTGGANGLKLSELMEFVDAGRNVLVATSSNVSDTVRQFANECGLDFDADETLVVDHANYHAELDAQFDADHTVVTASRLLAPERIARPMDSPIVFRGVSHIVNEKSPFVHKVIAAESSAFSGKPTAPLPEEAVTAGRNVLVSSVQIISNGRVTFAGSIDMFSDRFFNAASGGNSKNAKPSNQQLCNDVAMWTFQERGFLRARDLTHHAVDSKEMNPHNYRVGTQIEFSIVIEEFDGNTGKWVPFNGKDVLLEYVMLDPHIRKPLSTKGNGVYATSLQLPDNFGVYKFRVRYNKPGYSLLEVTQQVPARPYHHDEFDRFVPAAFPYYVSALSMMAGFFVFGLIFMYNSDK